MTIYQVQTNRATLLVQAGDGPTLIVNRDPTNALLLGPDAAVATAVQTNLSIVDPLGSRTVGGQVNVWGVAQNAQVTVDVQTDALTWSASPAQIAAQIQASGIFINTNSTEIANIPNTSVAHGSTTVFGPFNVNQIGYEIRIVSQWNGAPDPVDDFLAAVRLDWLDSTTGQIVYTDRWFMGASKSTGSALVTTGSGPTKGNQVKITLQNADLGTAGVTISCVLLINSRTYLKDDWRWSQPFTSGVTFTNYQNPVSLDGTNILARVNGNFAASSVSVYPLGLWAGRISLTWLEAAQGWTNGNPIVEWSVMLGGITGGVAGVTNIPLREPDGTYEFVNGRYPAAVRINNTNASGVTTSSFAAVGLD